MRLLFATMLVLALGTPASAVEAVLRELATPAGSLVRLADVAELTADPRATANAAAESTLVAELAAVPLMPAPAPGTSKFVTAAQIRDLLAAAAVDMQTVNIRGAARTAITAPAQRAASSPLGMLTPSPPSRELVADHVTNLITAYLREQTGHDAWNVTVSPDDNLVDMCWRYGTQVAITGGQAPWTGRQRFQLSAPGSVKPALAFAGVERVEVVVFALRPIARGDFVRATDVALRSYTGGVPAQAAMTIESVVGKEAVQPVRAGAMLMTNQVRAPFLVRRGEVVSVQARAAGVKVRTYATAQQDGSLGDLIAVVALDSKDRFSARVSGLRELDVLAISASAGDVASVGQ